MALRTKGAVTVDAGITQHHEASRSLEINDQINGKDGVPISGQVASANKKSMKQKRYYNAGIMQDQNIITTLR